MPRTARIAPNEHIYHALTIINRTVPFLRSDPNGNTTSYRFRNYYTASITDPYGQITYYDRDYARNLLMAVTDPLGRLTRYTYDQNGNTTSIVDPAGNTTIMEYDQTLNKPVKITDALGNVTTMKYDSKGNLTEIRDPKSQLSVITNTANLFL